MDTIRLGPLDSSDPVCMEYHENGEYVEYVVHKSLIDKMEARAIAAESKLDSMPLPQVIHDILNGWIAEDLTKQWGDVDSMVEARRAAFAVVSNLQDMVENWPNHDEIYLIKNPG